MVRLPNHHKPSTRTPHVRGQGGFTLLELIVVLVIMSLVLGLSTVALVNALPSSRLDAAAREFAAALRYGRSLAVNSGERQELSIDLDARQYSLAGRSAKTFPNEVTPAVLDPFEGEMRQGRHRIVFKPIGAAEGGALLLTQGKRTVRIEADPVIGAAVIKETTVSQ